jgi:ribosomal protein S18 acetylase RimI-like enzyme
MSAEEIKAPANVVEMPQKPKRRAKIDVIHPTDIVDVWRLCEHSLRAAPFSYPDLTEDQPEVIRAHLFQYLQSPMFTGLIARFNRRPVGSVLGNVALRPLGRPTKYAFIYGFWVEPQFRHQGIGKQLLEQFFARMKKIGVFSWEANASEALAEELTHKEGIKVLSLMRVIGGRM